MRAVATRVRFDGLDRRGKIEYVEALRKLRRQSHSGKIQGKVVTLALQVCCNTLTRERNNYTSLAVLAAVKIDVRYLITAFHYSFSLIRRGNRDRGGRA
jgi:hypothetical protein